MTQHLNEGQLRAGLDGELNSVEISHLENCADCQRRQSALQAEIGSASRRLTFLAPQEEEPVPQARPALSHYYEKTNLQKETSMIRKIFTNTAFRFALAAVLLLAVVVTIPSTRALADQLLNLFRVQQVAVVPVDFTGMQQLTGDQIFGKQVSQLLSSAITMTKKPGEPVTAADATQASQLAGFPIRLPEGFTPTRISVQDGAAFSFKIDLARAQALLDEAGRSDLVLPEAIDGAEISVNIPAGASIAYGNCPEPTGEEEGFNMNGEGSPGRRYADCILLAEIPSPSVEAPAGVDINQLAQLGLEFTGMTPEQAAAFTQTVDWTSTLVVPIPKNAATYRQVSVDGVTGTLIQRPADDAPQFALLWVKDGIIYAIGGLGSNSQQALEMANSLP